ncbi:MAG: hypothetical protein WB439_12355, partial [Acidobacteriaceae bacterium]
MPRATTLKPLVLIPFATLLVLHPLFIHGPSIGQDLNFHIQSWLDAAHQLHQGHYPHWDATAAWNAGEPRFLFYPPISWLLGALLTLIFPLNLCPTIFIAIALVASGLTFYKLASHFTTPNAALIASTLYLANPYMLFTAFERSALSELLAAAWIPLLLLALLRPRPTIRGVAIPLALLWLTNAPAAVIGSYTVALLATLRVIIAIASTQKLSSRPKAAGRSGETCSSIAPHAATSPASAGYPEASASGPISTQKERGFSPWDSQPQPTPLHLARTYLAGTLLGLTLPAFYLIPAATQRRFIQVAMAIFPNLRYQDNYLYTHTTDAAHNAVNHTISTIALTLLILTAATLLTLLISRTRKPSPPHEPFSPIPYPLPAILAFLTILIAILLTPISTPIWQHLPELPYLQFPWRLLTLLTPVLALATALLIDRATLMGAPFMRGTWRMSGRATLLAALLLPLAIAVPAYRLFHQPSNLTNSPSHLAQLFTTHHGFPPTDEYTPTTADNDPLRSNNPAYWLLPANTNPNTPAPNTTPTAAELNPTLDTDDTPIPDT